MGYFLFYVVAFEKWRGRSLLTLEKMFENVENILTNVTIFVANNWVSDNWVILKNLEVRYKKLYETKVIYRRANGLLCFIFFMRRRSADR